MNVRVLYNVCAWERDFLNVSSDLSSHKLQEDYLRHTIKSLSFPCWLCRHLCLYDVRPFPPSCRRLADTLSFCLLFVCCVLHVHMLTRSIRVSVCGLGWGELGPFLYPILTATGAHLYLTGCMYIVRIVTIYIYSINKNLKVSFTPIFWIHQLLLVSHTRDCYLKFLHAHNLNKMRDGPKNRIQRTINTAKC